ncbi:MAG: 1-deoxy-D-xylulose-5-phosphate reductoisomerase [Candidatus Omnitrophica bacterium]|nr:1-deoxy-D-xylulose-5-phosphate reductoisomerase [Candidatus Omnitrophota bacterium]
MKNIAILGASGSIGQNTLSVIRNYPDKFKVVALSVNSDIGRLSSQIREFRPLAVCVNDRDRALALSGKIKSGVKIFSGRQGLEELVRDKRIDQVVFAISGASALAPLVSAIESGKDVALANKEALVMAGPIILRLARKNKVRLMPIDSEQSAIWQCLEGEDRGALKKIYLTASGGPLRKLNKRELKNIRLKQVLKHPRWKMGRKITVDSATLMNKGLELLEAMFLFGLEASQVKVLVHPEALIHSMVEFVDGVLIAQLSTTDMRIPIQYALSYPQRLKNALPEIDFYKLGALHFEKPDLKKFPCLGLAYAAARRLGTFPCVLNAANEVAVAEFLKEKLEFRHIPEVSAKVMRLHTNKLNPALSDILQADTWARQEALRAIARLN